mgnify:CR=1 FL=1
MSMVLGTVGSVIGVTGWWFFDSNISLIIGIIMVIGEIILEWDNYNYNSKKYTVILFIIGTIVGAFKGAPIWVGGALALLIVNLIISLATIIFIGSVMKKTK